MGLRRSLRLACSVPVRWSLDPVWSGSGDGSCDTPGVDGYPPQFLFVAGGCAVGDVDAGEVWGLDDLVDEFEEALSLGLLFLVDAVVGVVAFALPDEGVGHALACRWWSVMRRSPSVVRVLRS